MLKILPESKKNLRVNGYLKLATDKNGKQSNMLCAEFICYFDCFFACHISQGYEKKFPRKSSRIFFLILSVFLV